MSFLISKQSQFKNLFLENASRYVFTREHTNAQNDTFQLFELDDRTERKPGQFYSNYP